MHVINNKRPTLLVKEIAFGEGIPKICVPIGGKTYEDFVVNANNCLNEEGWDLSELRIDGYENVLNHEELTQLIIKIKMITKHPILVTLRTLNEGGPIEVNDEDYFMIMKTIVDAQVDFIDVELTRGKKVVLQTVDYAHKQDVKVVMSSHDFNKTPDNQTIKERLENMEILGADICKIAVMPENKDDVSRLLNITDEMSYKLTRPLITMSMGKLGVLSRVSGEQFGSVMTFATIGEASAPGQIPVSQMKTILGILHND